MKNLIYFLESMARILANAEIQKPIIICEILAVVAFFVAFFPSSDARPGGGRIIAAAHDAAVILREDIFERAPFAECHASTIAETPAGLVAAWFGGTKEGSPDVKIWLSRNDGGSWSAPEEAAIGTGPGGERLPCWNPVLFQPRKGPLLLFYKVGRSPSSWWGMVRTSGDSGWTWTEPLRLPDGILGPVKNHPVEFADGTILCGSSTEQDGWRVHFEWTRDAGRTWAKTGDLNDGRSFGLIQPALLKVGGDGIIALMRSDAGRIYEARTADGGRTWTRPVPLELPNPNSGIDAVTLHDGRHLLVFNSSTSSRSPLSIALSEDGRAWRTVLALENEKGQEFSYPAVIQSADGRVHITYTWKRLRIRHVVLDPRPVLKRRPLFHTEPVLICQIYDMGLEEFLDGLDGFIFKCRRTLRDPHGKVIELLRIDSNPFFILIEEYKERSHGDSLIPVLERVILDHEIKEYARFGDERRIERLLGETLKRSRQAALQEIGKAG